MPYKVCKVDPEPKAPKKKIACSKKLTTLTLVFGFIIAQECIYLMYLCIVNGYTAAAAWLTAAIGLAEVVIGLGLNSYLGLSKAENTTGGITMEIYKAQNSAVQEVTESAESPAI